MLRIQLGGKEHYDESNNKFVVVNGVDVELEHSLISLSKWESKFQKPFLSEGNKTNDELLGYVDAMILTPDYPKEVLDRISPEEMSKINDHMDSKQSATTFPISRETKGKSETVTSELIYYWMVTFNIPFECETWHLNRLFSLIRICNLKNAKPVKRSANQIAQERRELNAQRRSQMGTSG